MSKYLLGLVSLLVVGCTSLAAKLPSVDNCQHVTYARDYSKIQITADCDVANSGLIE